MFPEFYGRFGFELDRAKKSTVSAVLMNLESRVWNIFYLCKCIARTHTSTHSSSLQEVELCPGYGPLDLSSVSIGLLILNALGFYFKHVKKEK